ncbi:DedA family protein [Salsuginibacillus kocurii]|uniref:DedA family protein n=1 Tax=Salsuginibacillus kocurii TaxID=427078 RepID=UPI00036364F2|nr:VTT domain-containing protein [Salsuginibacillus kocurii]
MLEFILSILEQLGIVGLILGVAIEALSIPFPAAIFMLAYGYILDPGWTDWFLLSLLSSGIYMVVSFIPYLLANRYHYLFKKKLNSGRLKRMQHMVEKYGEWAIAGGRMVGMGYIAYVAAFCEIRPFRYGLFTFIGVFPTALLMFYLGQLGNIEVIYNWFQRFQYVIFSIIALLIGGYIALRLYQVKRAKKTRKSINR